MNLTEYNKYLTHFVTTNEAPMCWTKGKVAFSKAYSYFGEDWGKTLQLAQDFIDFKRINI